MKITNQYQVCLARASQRLLALWHVFNHAFAGQQATFVSVISRDPPKLCDACFTTSTCLSIDYTGMYYKVYAADLVCMLLTQ
jgi:hypothetical protein